MTMPKPSTITSLPPDILEQLQALLRDPRVTQLDATKRINAILTEQGQEPLSKSAVNRYSMKMDRIGNKLQQSRAIAEMWIGKLGSEPAGQTGKLLNEVVRNLAFDAAMHMAEDEEPAHPGAIKELAIAIEKLENAASKNEQRDAVIRKQAREEAAAELTQELKNDGISEELEASIRRILLGKA
jgi:hypothetical protein